VVEMTTEFTKQELELLCQKFISHETLIVGFSTTFWQKHNNLLTTKITDIINCVKEINSNTKIVAGGANAIQFVNGLHNYNIDAIFLGYAEHYFIKYLNSLLSKTPLPFPSRIVNKTKIYDFVEKSDVFEFCNSSVEYSESDCLYPGEPVILEVARGCIFKCKFCSYPLTGKKKLDHLKDPDVLRTELMRNYDKFKIDKYLISDDTFNDSNEKLKYLHEIFTSLPFKIKFATYLRLDLLNAHRQQIELLEEMGLAGANFGIESLHEKAARSIGKGISPALAKQLLYDLKDKYWKNNVPIQINLITGLPFETLESYQETEKWILSDDCLVDSVSLSHLGLRNPKSTKGQWQSEFELNSEKYGYYWKENSDQIWFNDIHPVKSTFMATDIKNILETAVIKTNRKLLGGFNHFSKFLTTQFFTEQKSFDDQIKMNRHQYTEYFLNGLTTDPITPYINLYKQKIFNV
jgi:radical SAM superfamily enzyme YgiQ (UPF0313 family)